MTNEREFLTIKEMEEVVGIIQELQESVEEGAAQISELLRTDPKYQYYDQIMDNLSEATYKIRDINENLLGCDDPDW